MLHQSNIDDLLVRITDNQNKQMAIFGDKAYPFRSYLWVPCKKTLLTAEESAFNNYMKPVRECVEWGFGKLGKLFAFTDFGKNQKIFLQSVGKHFMVSALLCNAHSCVYGSQISQYYNLDPPSLEEYFQ
jgi:hypothetical protein